MEHTRTHLVIVYFDLGLGGVQRKITDIANRLSVYPPGAAVQISILLEKNTGTALAAQIRNPRVTIYRKPRHRLPYWAYIAWFMLRSNPTHILSFLPVPSVHAYIAAKILFWKNIRFVVSQDTVTSQAFARGDFSPLINSLIHLAFSRASVLLVPSEEIKKDLIHHYGLPPSSVTISPNWVTRQTKSGSVPARIDALYAGRLDAEKRIPLLIRLFSHVCSHIPNASLGIIGQGKQQEAVMQAIARYRLGKNVQTADFVTNIQTLLHTTKIALYTSESEGTPMFLLEAMTQGVPVVCLHYPGIETTVIHGKSGFICSTYTQFIRSTVALLKNPVLRRSMGANAKNHARKYFSASNIDSFIINLLSRQP